MATTSPGNRIGYFFLALFAIFVGLYPVVFAFIIPPEEGLIGSKPVELLDKAFYLPVLYTHTSVGGIALLAGFSQFFKSLRRKRLNLHRTLGKIYVIAVLISGSAALISAFFATGGMVTAIGFGLLAILWLYTTVQAYVTIRRKDINAHQRWMIRSYALCFAAVTLRIILPSLQFGLGMGFLSAYMIVSWACWVPNILVAELLIIPRLRTS